MSPWTSTRRWLARVAALVVAAAVATIAVPAAVPGVAPTAAAQTAFGAYLFAYFTGEGSADGEQIRFAVSRGDDPLRYDVLNAGRPILVSTVGTRGVRDPHVLRKQDGTFVLIATDLRIHGNGAWDASQRTGSRSIVIWESADLVNWSAPRLAQVADSTAGNVWAPEAIWDPARNAYVVFWASKLYSPNDPNHTANTHNRMLYATTTDFRTFSAPQVWVDPGYSVIDSTVIADRGTYYRFTKDERGNSSSSPCGLFVTQERSTTLASTAWAFQRECIGRGVVGAGEGPTVVKSNTENRWYLFLDEYGGRGYVPLTTTDLASAQWTPVQGASLPANPRHGTVMPITTAELNRLAGTARTTAVTGNRTMQAVTPGFADRSWRHQDFVVGTAQTTSSSSETQRADSTFTVVPGLADSGCYSFRSRNFPDRYLRHYDYAVRIDPVQDSTVYRADATFCARPGLSGQGVSWQSVTVPTRYLRHYDNVLYLAANGGPRPYDSTSDFAVDATWNSIAPLAP